MAEESIRIDSMRDPEAVPHALSIMARAAIAHLGEPVWTECLNRARASFANNGILGWKVDDGNVLMDIVPMPEPNRGQWGYRLIFAAHRGQEVHVAKFIFPHSEVKQS